MTDNDREQTELAEASGAPTVTQGGAMPGRSESPNNQNAYPRPDASVPGKVPQVIADTMGDPTGDRNREQLLVLAQNQGIDGVDEMNRAQLADALKDAMSPEDLFYAVAAQKTQ